MNEMQPNSLQQGVADCPSASRSVLYRVAYLVAEGLQLLVVGLLVELLLFSQIELHLGFRLAVIAVLLVGTAKGQGWPILLATQASLFLSEPSRGPDLGSTGSLIFCCLVLLVVAYAYSFQSTGARLSRWIATLASGTVSEPARWRLSNPLRAQLFALMGSTLFVLLASVLAGGLLLRFLPLTMAGRITWLQRSLATGSTFWPGATVLTCAIVFVVILREISWRQMVAGQARIYARSSFIQEQFWDLRMIVLRQLKLRRRTAANQKKSSKTSSALKSD